jgi:bacteriocin biosynthesis cyclodehydratase domain-containing protein
VDRSSPNASSEPVRLCALPCQLVEVDHGVMIVRGATEIKVLGDRALEVVRQLLSIAGSGEVTAADIGARFAGVDREAVDHLVEWLTERRVLVESGPGGHTPIKRPETSAEIFYWNCDLTEAEASARLSAQTIVVLGVNAVSARLASSLIACGAGSLAIVDLALVRNQRLFGGDESVRVDEWPADAPRPIRYGEWLDSHDPAALDCVVLTSDFAATSVAIDWNRVCLARGISFLPVILRRLIGHVGPLVIPGHTACYECMVARENAHLGDHALLRASEARGPYGQATSGTLRPMASILGDIAAVELTKFYTRVLPPTVGTRIDVNLLVPSLETRHVLRAPRCQACAPAVHRPSNSLERVDFTPGRQFVAGDGGDSAGLIPDLLRDRIAT